MFGAAQGGGRVFGEGGEVEGVAPAGGDGLRCFVEAFEAVGGDGFEHAVAEFGGVGGGCRGGEEGAVDQAGDQVEDVVVLGGGPGESRGGLWEQDRFRALQGEAAAEYREAAKGALFRGRQEFPAPVDHRAQGALAGGGVAADLVQEAEAVVQAVGEGVDAEGAYAGGGEFDGERDAVQAAADEGGGLTVAVVQYEAGGGGLGAGGEQAQGVLLAERGDGRKGLAGQGEGFLAGGEDAQVGGVAQELGGEFGGGAEDVFAVVEDEEETAVGEGAAEADGTGQGVGDGGGCGGGGGRFWWWLRLLLPRPRVVAYAQGRRHGGRHLAACSREFGEPDAVGEVGRKARRRLQGEAGLADAAGSGERDQAPGGYQGANTGGGLFASDEAGDLGREVGQGTLDHGSSHGRGHGNGRVRGRGCGGRGYGGRGHRCRQPRVLAEHGLVQGGEFGARVDAEFVGETEAQVAVGVQGVGRAAGAVEGAHVGGPQAFAERLVGDERRQFVGQYGVFAEVETEFGQRLLGGEALFLQARDRRPREVGVAEVGVGGSVPERQGVGQEGDFRARVRACVRG